MAVNSTTDTVSDESYSLDLTDTVSSSWQDDGTDDLTDNDSLTGETDDYTWGDLHSITYEITMEDSWQEGSPVTLTTGIWDAVRSDADSAGRRPVWCRRCKRRGRWQPNANANPHANAPL